MKKLILIFCITFAITFIGQMVYNYNQVAIDKYIRNQIKQAKLINVITKYTIKPEGLEG